LPFALLHDENEDSGCDETTTMTTMATAVRPMIRLAKPATDSNNMSHGISKQNKTLATATAEVTESSILHGFRKLCINFLAPPHQLSMSAKKQD
jgi:hypothetical protein